MTTRIERMSQAYRDSKPSIDTGGIIRRVQLESALAEEEAGIAVGRFGQGMGLVQSLGAFTGQLSEQKRLAKRAGIYESEILDVNKSIQEFRSESEKATEAMLGRPMTKKEKAMGLTDEELGMQYTDEEVKGLGLQRKKTRFQNLLEMLRG